jgi:hypothetical protein
VVNVRPTEDIIKAHIKIVRKFIQDLKVWPALAIFVHGERAAGYVCIISELLLGEIFASSEVA